MPRLPSRRSRTQAMKWGEEVRTMRLRHGLTIQAAADRVRVAWATWARIEAGDPRAALVTLCDIGESIGLDLVLNAYVGRPPSLRDTGQLGIAEWIRGQAHASFNPDLESEVGTHGQSIDLVLFGPTEIIAIEIERMLVDFQAQYRRALQKRDLLADLHQRPVRLVLALNDGRRNRAIVRPHAALLAHALPAGSRDVLRAIRTGAPLDRDGLVWVRAPAPSYLE